MKQAQNTPGVGFRFVVTPREHKRRSKVAQRIESLGLLNDEYLRLVSLPILDREGLLKLAVEYETAHCPARAHEIRMEAGG